MILLTLLVVLPARRLPAQDTSCQAVDMDDMPRPCTFLEEHGACLWYALDSYYMCRDGSDGFLSRLGCEVGVQVDLLACNLSLPWRVIESILH
jgi:hypothetical protein